MRLVATLVALGTWVFVGATAATPSAVAQNHPAPQEMTLSPTTTALLVLDLSERCADPAQVCSELAPRVRPLIDRARAAGVFIVYTVSSNELEAGRGAVWPGFDARPDEPVIYPGAHWDKFVDSDLDAMLRARGIDTLIMTGSSSNIAILYTASTAGKVYGYHVVIPYDGMNSSSPYQDEYTVHQLSVLPSGVSELISFTTIDQIQFGPPTARD